MADCCKILSMNVFDIDNPNILNGYIDSSGNYNPYATNGTLYVSVTDGNIYDISGIIRVNPSLIVRIATFDSIPSTRTPCINLYELSQGSALKITVGMNENYLLMVFCGDSDYSAYGSVTAALTANCTNLKIKELKHSLKKFDGANWIDASVKEWDGSDWQ